ncbi:MAG: c-type cytochrome biogenesis protein CcsB [Bacteroidales bacterium]|nr:c-type cytochrome biogenesis protein CcsB [Bacteroidales bacterium]
MKVIKFIFSPVFMGVFLVIFAVAMAVATFIENDFGTSAAYGMVYDTRWFEIILLLLAVNLIGQLIIFKLFRRVKLPVALFHISFVLMIIGAGITRYFGWEGVIHIREGETSNICFSNENYIGYTVKDNDGSLIRSHSQKYSITSVSADNYKKKISVGNKNYKLILAGIVPNATETITDSPEGEPAVSLLVTKDMNLRETMVLKEGESKTLQGLTFGFNTANKTDVSVKLDSGTFLISSIYVLAQMSMMTQETTISEPGKQSELKPMQVITVQDIKVVAQKLSLAGTVNPASVDPEEQETGQDVFIFQLLAGDQSETVYLWDRNTEEITSGSCIIDGKTFEITYGSKISTLPFSLKLDDFVLERYPGSNSPSGYRSEVILIDERDKVEKPYSVFMNNILKYKGYRFYQSSFDQDEKGTILSVSHDRAGMIVTYTGYAMLFLFIILSLFSKNSVFRNINAGYWHSSLRKTVTTLALIFILSGLSVANAQKFVAGKAGSDEFGKVLVQDQKGRTKPLFTLSNDILRKVTRENKFEGLTSMQVFLGLYFDFNSWKDVPLIRVTSRDLQRSIGIKGNLASFSDLVNLEGNGMYKLSEEVNAAYAKSPGERNKMDKEVMKVDERVNIVYMIYKGDFMKIFPLKDGTHNWGSPDEALEKAVSKDDSLYLKNIIPALAEALQTNNDVTAARLSASVREYQDRFTEYALPSAAKTGIELFYYKLSIFEKLFPFYATTGLIMLLGLIIAVIRGRNKSSLFVRGLGWLLFAGFLFHTLGLGLRWYIAGHSPMSNGYESMLFISWVTLLAGFIFSRKSIFALSATAVLAGMTLMVAHLSFMDPEITNLVPVLKSYWLTLHVSVITGSYGFLGLGAILGLITMILLVLSNGRNRERIADTIDELTVINYKTLTLGLYFLTIGTFLGAVWANESWGRYWGWDPKETWSLITIVIYSLVIHSRLIPGMKDIYTFNLLSLFAFSSVLMTYFGVNYYLSGLHSYASGDPVPVPVFVYITVLVLVLLSMGAYFGYNRFKKAGE